MEVICVQGVEMWAEYKRGGRGVSDTVGGRWLNADGKGGFRTGEAVRATSEWYNLGLEEG